MLLNKKYRSINSNVAQLSYRLAHFKVKYFASK